MEAAGGGAGGPDDGREGREGPEGQVDYHGLGGAGAEAAGAGAEAGVSAKLRVSRGHCTSRVGRRCHVHDRNAGSPSVHLPSAVCVPFLSHLEAVVACASLVPYHDPHGGTVEEEFSVFGSILAARWRAEDPRLLRLSIINFLDQLSLVMENTQRLGPRIPAKSALGTGD